MSREKKALRPLDVHAQRVLAELGGIAGALGTTGAEIMRRAEAATSPVLAVSSGGVPSPQEVLDHEVACVCRRSCTLGRGSRPTAATAGLQAWV